MNIKEQQTHKLTKIPCTIAQWIAIHMAQVRVSCDSVFRRCRRDIHEASAKRTDGSTKFPEKVSLSHKPGFTGEPVVFTCLFHSGETLQNEPVEKVQTFTSHAILALLKRSQTESCSGACTARSIGGGKTVSRTAY